MYRGLLNLFFVYRAFTEISDRMFQWLFYRDIETPVCNDREFDFYLIASSPPAPPPQCLAFDDAEPIRSVPLNAMQMMFNPQSFKANFLYWKFHQEICKQLAN